jgi:V8-like Glu-specific endopeptidase
MSTRQSLRALMAPLGVLLAAALLAACSALPPTSTPSPGHLRARSFTGLSSVGPLFPPSSTLHSCTASVVASSGGDLLLTAAHCLSGTGLGWRFVPGYDRGSAPEGSWSIVALYAPRAWLEGSSPMADYVIARVASRRLGATTETLEEAAGAATLASSPAAGTRVQVPAYALGRDDAPRTCTATLRYQGAYPRFDCSPYPDGTSGAPFLVRGAGRELVVGVIGGLHQGGCTPEVSYSAPFAASTLRFFVQVEAGQAPSVLPPRPSDGC